MPDFFQVNPQLEIPIYQQLVDHIRAHIKTGRLPAGAQLPTVRKLADELDLAHGTIKRAYDELEKEGLVEKVQGRGTFVSYQPENLESRKERAMVAIDQLFDQLEKMNFSISEMNIFIRLKLQERAAQQANLKIAVVADTPELLSQLCEQLRQIGHLDLYASLLEEVLTYPYKIGEDMDLVITTREHAEVLEKLAPCGQKIAKVAAVPCTGCIARMARLQDGAVVGILCQSLGFGELLAQACHRLGTRVTVAEPCLISGDCAGYLRDKTAVLVPESYERYADAPGIQAIETFADRGAVIPCAYCIDEGSRMYLGEKIQELLDKDRL